MHDYHIFWKRGVNLEAFLQNCVVRMSMIIYRLWFIIVWCRRWYNKINGPWFFNRYLVYLIGRLQRLLLKWERCALDLLWRERSLLVRTFGISLQRFGFLHFGICQFESMMILDTLEGRITYPTWGIGKSSSSKMPLKGDMWSLPGGYPWVHQFILLRCLGHQQIIRSSEMTGCTGPFTRHKAIKPKKEICMLAKPCASQGERFSGRQGFDSYFPILNEAF